MGESFKRLVCKKLCRIKDFLLTSIRHSPISPKLLLDFYHFVQYGAIKKEQPQNQWSCPCKVLQVIPINNPRYYLKTDKAQEISTRILIIF